MTAISSTGNIIINTVTHKQTDILTSISKLSTRRRLTVNWRVDRSKVMAKGLWLGLGEALSMDGGMDTDTDQTQ